MSDAIPTAKQSLRGIITGLFPWLSGFVAVGAGAAKGLAIRTASGLLHLAGGPDDPAVHRKGDAGTAGSIILVGAPGAGTGFTITNAAGATVTYSFALTGGAVVVSATSLLAFPLDTKSTEGSEKVTCA